MTIIIWGIVAIICLYSFAFGVVLWKQKNKAGSIVVILLSAICLALPYFSLISFNWPE